MMAAMHITAEFEPFEIYIQFYTDDNIRIDITAETGMPTIGQFSTMVWTTIDSYESAAILINDICKLVIMGDAIDYKELADYREIDIYIICLIEDKLIELGYIHEN